MSSRSKWESMTTAVKEAFKARPVPYDEHTEQRPTVDITPDEKRKLDDEVERQTK